MRQFVTNEQEAHHRTLGTCARLSSELQRALHEHGLVSKERERLDAELTRAVDGYDSLKAHLHRVIMEALKSGLGSGSINGSSSDATGDIHLDAIAKIGAIIDTELQAGVCKCPSFLLT